MLGMVPSLGSNTSFPRGPPSMVLRFRVDYRPRLLNLLPSLRLHFDDVGHQN